VLFWTHCVPALLGAAPPPRKPCSRSATDYLTAGREQQSLVVKKEGESRGLIPRTGTRKAGPCPTPQRGAEQSAQLRLRTHEVC